MNMIDWDSCVLWLDSKYFSESYWWDRSRYRNNGVVYGAEFKNESFYFDGSNDYVDCGDNDSLNIGDELSIECLFIPYGDGYIIAKRNWNNWDDAYALAYEEAYRRLIFLGNGASAARSNSNILPFNEKAHIVVTAKNSGSVKFYKNGKLTGEWKLYHKNKSLYQVRLWENGKLMEIISCFDNIGQALDMGTLINGNGTLNEYDDTGKLTKVKTYKNGEEQK